MKKKIAIFLAIIMIVAVLSTVLVACGDNSGDGDGGNDGGGSSSTSIKLMVYAPADNTVKAKYGEMLEKFTEETGIKVIPSYISKDEYNRKLQTSMMTKKQPDVFFLDQPMLATFADLCLNLDEGFFAKEGEEGLHFDDFFKVAQDTVIYKDSIYAVPFSLTTSILLYNKDLVKSVPTSWEEWRNMSVDSDKALFGGISSGGYASWYFQAFLKSAGGDMISGNQVVFNNAQGVAAAQMIKDLYDKSNKNIRESTNAFTNGKVMFVLAHNADIYNYFTTNSKFCESSLGATCFIPQNKGGTSYSNIGGENIAINKNSSNIEACKQLVKFLLREENVNIAIANNFSAIREYAKVRTEDPITGAQYSQALQDAMKVVLKQLDTASARPVVENWLSVNDEYLANALAKILDSNADIQSTLDKAQQTAMAELKF